jgi:hypothetical protein
MMSNYVIDVYVSSDPGTYMVRIRFAFKPGVTHRLSTRLGSITIARSWWSAIVGRSPRGGTAVGP